MKTMLKAGNRGTQPMARVSTVAGNAQLRDRVIESRTAAIVEFGVRHD
jgi:hypothetical protein